MLNHGFLRVAAAVPRLRVADCEFNADQIIGLMQRAEAEEVRVLVFPELCITGYTCGDLFHHATLLDGALAALVRIARATNGGFGGLAVVGVPLRHDGQLFNCAAVLHRGKVLAVIPKSYLPNYKEFYEDRWFSPAGNAATKTIQIDNNSVPFGAERLFEANDAPGTVIGVEICEDLWVPVPPSSFQALGGATVLLNLSASNEVIGKSAYRRQLVADQSGRCMTAYVYCSCGIDESTTDLVFGGHCLVAENGAILAESRRFEREEHLLATDIDIDRLLSDRLRQGTFSDALTHADMKREFTRSTFGTGGSRLGFHAGAAATESRL